jgi:hypothetical protein
VARLIARAAVTETAVEDLIAVLGDLAGAAVLSDGSATGFTVTSGDQQVVVVGTGFTYFFGLPISGIIRSRN